MPPFNWFTRKSGDRPAEPESPSQNTPEGVVEDRASTGQTVEADAPAADASTPVAEDYLSWAKAAYQNIQKQKASSETQPAEPEAQTETLSEPSSIDAVDLDVVDEVVEEIVQAPAPAPDTTEVDKSIEGAIADDAVRAESEEIEPTEAVTASEAEAESPAAPEPAAQSLPFWAKAEAERLERLERLKETAIEPEPEPETEPEPAAASTQQVAFDENFIWSAGVLAAQGRRPEDISVEEITWLKRLRQGLGKTRRSLINQLRGIVGQGPLNQDAVMEIESLLLQADVGVEATDYVIDALQTKMRQEALPPDVAIAYLKQILRDMLDQPYQGSFEQVFAPQKGVLNIWLITGVNGAGKTTTIGKLAHLARKSDYSCLIAAADTFRAAAVEQVKVWGQRSNVEVIANPGKNTDPAAVVFDAIAAAQSRGTELLLVDTAGRLQNKKNLMDELSKIRRIVDRKAPDAVVESLLVLDSTLGQNGLRQAEVFSEAAKLSGVVLTKLDGTAKGGVALAVVKQLGLPIRFIGAGEGIEDLRPFSSYEFVEALLSG